jgi:choline dehydrogenase-like flavoprotein
MVYIRGHRADYDQWAALGNTGWSFADVLPYFKRSENNAELDGEYHGKGGPLMLTCSRTTGRRSYGGRARAQFRICEDPRRGAGRPRHLSGHQKNGER